MNMYKKIILLLIIIHTIYPSQLILQSTQDNKYLLHSKYFKNSNKLIKVYLRQIKSSKIFRKNNKENNLRNLSY